MNLTTLVQKLKAFDRRMWPAHRVAMTPELTAALESRKLIVADVGSADGPEERWLGLKKFLRFVTFEPNPRAGAGADLDVVNFPIGLWSSKGERTLFLTRHQDSSSLYPVNEAAFRDFLIKDGIEQVGELKIALDTLDNCLATKPELSPDFMKIDVESADLEVLRGSEMALRRTIAGVRAETSFVEVRRGSPLLWEIDTFLRERGFMLFHLGRYHWIRNNGLHGFTSQPQLIWGDAIYFLGREQFIARLAACPEREREAMLVRFIVILLCHGVHDYTLEVIGAAEAAGHICAASARSLNNAVAQSADRSIIYFLRSFCGLLFACAVYLVACPAASARWQATNYVKRRAGRFFYDLWRWTAKGGHPQTSCVEDRFV